MSSSSQVKSKLPRVDASAPSKEAFDKQRRRSLESWNALRRAVKFARERLAICERERDCYKIEKPTEPYWHMSEQAAAHEARHIAEHLEQDLYRIDKRFKRRPDRWDDMADDAGAYLTGLVREAAKEATGGNYTFADDDLTVLKFLAIAAIKAGLVDCLHPDIAAKAKALHGDGGAKPPSTAEPDDATRNEVERRDRP